MNDIYRNQIPLDYSAALSKYYYIHSKYTHPFSIGQQQLGQDQSQFMSFNRSDVYSTKQYYDYYQSLKPRDPLLPKPTYQPLDLTEQYK
jgi:hypothetical protein